MISFYRQASSKSLSVKLKLPNRVQPEFIPQHGREGRYTNKLHFFKKHLLDEAHKKKYALDFLEPVDTEALKVPTYYTVIDRPMDIGTILKRVQNNYYRSINEAIADFKLIIRNCFVFNQPGDVVYRKGQMLEKFFTRKLRCLPPGPEMPCNKDPKATGRSRTNVRKMVSSAQTERSCRDLLKKLQNLTNQSETTARNFFNTKWDSLQKKLDRQHFKSVHDFCMNVDGIFRKYHEPAKVIYERAFSQPGTWWASMNVVPSSSVHSALDGADLNELLAAAKAAENGLVQCLQLPDSWEPLRAKGLVETFSGTLRKMIYKLEAANRSSQKPSSSKRQSLSPKQEKDLVQGECKPAKDLLTSSEIDSLMVVSIESSDDEDIDVSANVPEAERHAIQKLFAKLPTNAMKEIIHMVQQIEGFSSESCGDLSFDVKGFAPDTMVLMKNAATKAMRAHSKLNLRDMQPSEKEGLQRSLQSQLVDITRMLNKNRRRTGGSLVNFRTKNNNCNNVVRKRPTAPLSAKLKPPPGNVVAPKLGMGVGESRNLSDTSDDSSAPTSPVRQRPIDATPMGNLPKMSNPLQTQPFGPQGLTIVAELQMSSSSESEKKSHSGRNSRPKLSSRSSSCSSSSSSSSSSSGSSSASSSESSEDEGVSRAPEAQLGMGQSS
ncbi:uncharacterized protein Dere_GG21955 [Drosophila erecta]|uniref:Bromo domain-containing protein n=1 Tax=Drosophila erecta TaxID=7220 RepID=B3NJH7_DROER|nr:uncharacterized protein Dere_GG21955 [Drosophila erecta]